MRPRAVHMLACTGDKDTHTHTHTHTGDILVVDPRSARVAMEIDAHDRKIATVDAQDAQVCITRASSMSWRVRARSLTSSPSSDVKLAFI